MAGKQRIYKAKIRATSTLEKVFRAMELIAASRIAKARAAAQGQDPYTQALVHSIKMVAATAEANHPLVTPRTDTKKVVVFVVTSDRGMAGAYSQSVLRVTDKLLADLSAEGKEPVLYLSGRRAAQYYHFRGVPVEGEWQGHSEHPDERIVQEIADSLLQRFMSTAADGGVAEIYVVYTRFISMVTQHVHIRRLLPIEVVDPPTVGKASASGDEATAAQAQAGSDAGTSVTNDAASVATPGASGVAGARKSDAPAADKPLPLYDYEPSAQAVFDTLLPMYVSSRIRGILLMAAASELAARQQAMHSATENAQELINKYTRLANNARQAEITTEITEIVSGADALGRN